MKKFWKEKEKIDMDEEKREREDLEKISVQLQSINTLILTVCEGLKKEYIEPQVIECLECIAQCVQSTGLIADKYLNK
jgi:hypothetical protein